MNDFPSPPGVGDLLVPAINRLQDVFAEARLDFALDLPQIAVVGSQSAGKSSVLESLVGRDFLPRGPDICTRRPLVLQLVKTAPRPGHPEEWGEFLHLTGQRFTDFKAIRKEIENETARITGTNKGVSDKPIRLRIFSPYVLTMTLVDLPGITRVPVGDQPSDIEARIRQMITSYIRHPSCLILAVSQANVDLANSDALHMARAVDPDGERTIGVLTKLDLMDRGTNASAALANRVVPLRLGYVGIVGRSQHDIATGKGIREALSDAEMWFRTHPEYSEVLDRCGVPALGRTISQILAQHIHSLLPQLKRQVEGALARKTRELSDYGDPAGVSTASRGGLLLKIITEYHERFVAMLSGRSEDLPTSELAGGARIRHIFQEIFSNALEECDPSRDLTDEEIRTAIRNSGGVGGSLMIPEAPFEILVRTAIRKLLPPALACSHLVHQELLRIAAACLSGPLERFPLLVRELDSAVADLIAKGAEPCEAMLRDLVDCELAFINTAHPSFIGGAQAVAAVIDRRRAEALAGPAAPAGASSGVLHKTAVLAGMGHVGVSRMSPSKPGAPPGEESEGEDSDDGTGTSAEDDAGGFGEATGMGPGAVGAAPNTLGDSRGPLRAPPAVLHVGRGASEQEEIEVEVTRLLVDSYYSIVRGTMQDMVPKAIMQFLVGSISRGLHQHLIKALYREERLEMLMSEAPETRHKRERCLEAVSALTKAMAALDTIPQEMQQRLSLARSVALPTGSLMPPAAPGAPHTEHQGGHHASHGRGPSRGQRGGEGARDVEREGGRDGGWGRGMRGAERAGEGSRFGYEGDGRGGGTAGVPNGYIGGGEVGDALRGGLENLARIGRHGKGERGVHDASLSALSASGGR